MEQVYDISLSSKVYKEMIMKLSTSLVWKDSTTANKFEDSFDLYDIEIFMLANRGLLSFEMVEKFPAYVFEVLHISEDRIKIYMKDKNKIPPQIRQDLVDIYQESLRYIDPDTGRHRYNVPKVVGGILQDNYIDTYVEKNEYYRMLMGLPSKESDYVFNTKKAEWGFNTPIHEMSLDIISDMKKDGYLDTLIKENPKKTYLKYLGLNAIDCFTARNAERFDIIKIDTSGVSDAMVQDFLLAYKRSARLVNDVYYNPALRKQNEYYDAFLAMCVLFMTIQIMNAKYLKADINRDFYDTESLKVVYDSYGVPFYKDIPLEYHKRIVKNLNILISYKGTNQVFFDLFSIFDLGSMTVFGYYLTKVHRMNADGTPVFIYDSDGKLSEDQSGAYDIRFSSCELGQDPSLHIADPNNIVKYEDIITIDPYWQNDKDLIDKLNNEEFNYLETKYIGIRSVFDLMAMTYENAYVIKMIFDMKKSTKNIMLDIGSLRVSTFDAFIYLGALYCKAKGWEGIISTEASTVFRYLGYNFVDTMETIKKITGYNLYLKDDKILQNAIKRINPKDVRTLNDSIARIPKLREHIVECMSKSTDLDHYRTYRKLYDVLMTSNYISGIFDKDNKDTTFEKVLMESSPSLYARYTYVTNIPTEVDTVIRNIQKQLLNYKYISNLFSQNTTLIDSLFKILNFFKSAKAELVNCSMVYVLSGRGLSFMKYMDQIIRLSEIVSPKNDEFNLIDILNWEKIEINKLASKLGFDINMHVLQDSKNFKDDIRVDDKFIIELTKFIQNKDDLQLLDLEPICIETKRYNIVDILLNSLKLREELYSNESKLFLDRMPTFKDLLLLMAGMEYKINDNLGFIDLDVNNITTKWNEITDVLLNSIDLKEDLYFMGRSYFKDNFINIRDTIKLLDEIAYNLKSELSLFDLDKIKSKSTSTVINDILLNSLYFKESLKKLDIINFKDRILSNKDLLMILKEVGYKLKEEFSIIDIINTMSLSKNSLSSNCEFDDSLIIVED